MQDKCLTCSNYLPALDRCKFCSYEQETKLDEETMMKIIKLLLEKRL